MLFKPEVIFTSRVHFTFKMFFLLKGFGEVEGGRETNCFFCKWITNDTAK